MRTLGRRLELRSPARREDFRSVIRNVVLDLGSSRHRGTFQLQHELLLVSVMRDRSGVYNMILGCRLIDQRVEQFNTPVAGMRQVEVLEEAIKAGGKMNLWPLTPCPQRGGSRRSFGLRR